MVKMNLQFPDIKYFVYLQDIHFSFKVTIQHIGQ